MENIIQKNNRKRRHVSFDYTVEIAEVMKKLRKKKFFSFVHEFVSESELNDWLENLPLINCKEDNDGDEKSKKLNDGNKTDLLLLLRHSHKCEFSVDRCKTPFCHAARLLWTHFMHCTNWSGCTVTHCASSKHVVHHFLVCTNASSCQICVPMHKAMKQNFEIHAFKLLCLQHGDKV
jgi:hypothetical protein